MSVILTNGATSLIFRDADFQVLKVPPWQTPQRLIDNSVGLPRVHNISGGRRARALNCQLSMFGDDKASTVQGAESLISFFEGTDHTGVDGISKTFMLTDADGVSYQVRFVDDLAGGLIEGPFNQFNGGITLLNEHTLPTDGPNPARGWWAAYDMDGNGGNLSNWTHDEAVGATGGNEWIDLTGNGYDAEQTTAGNRPQLQTTSNLINNRPAVDFISANSERLDISGNFDGWIDGLQDQPFSFYSVVNPNVITGNTDTILGFGNSNGGVTDTLQIGFAEVLPSDNDYYVKIDDGSTAKVGQTITDLAVENQSIIVSVISTGTTVDYYVDGVKIIDAADFDTGGVDFSDPATIGATQSAGVYTWFLDGQIGEIVFFDVQHTDLDRRRQEFRLSDMWGIDLTG